MHAQVKHVLNQQDTGGTREREGPLAEIGFWQHRGGNLSGIELQLDAPGESGSGLRLTLLVRTSELLIRGVHAATSN